MPLKIVRNDIVKMSCDAIVNPTNEWLWPGGGADEAIHRAAGPGLLAACREIGKCEVGKARLTPAFDLDARFVIHTVGPVWQGGNASEREQLISCYRESLTLAYENGCESIAIPLISSGTHGYPKDKVLKVAIGAITDFLFENEMNVFLVVFDRTSYTLSEKLFTSVRSFIDDRYADEAVSQEICYNSSTDDLRLYRLLGNRKIQRSSRSAVPQHKKGLEDMLAEMDKGFADMLFSLIDARGMTDVECYKRANVDKKTFSKIKCNKGYRPSKLTAVSFALALKLNLEETNELLRTVGMSLSHSYVFDIAIEYFITNEIYDFITINEILFELDQPTLGCIE